MNVKATKRTIKSRQSPMAVEDDERHTKEFSDFVGRNRKALNASIAKAREDAARGQVSKKSIKDIVSEGRRRHATKA